jgi:cation/acetate symporter
VPVVALAAILVVAGVSLVDFRELAVIRRIDPREFWLANVVTVGVVAFIVLLALLEQIGLSRRWIGLIFLLGTLALYATIGILSRTTDEVEYYVAGRRVPAF